MVTEKSRASRLDRTGRQNLAAEKTPTRHVLTIYPYVNILPI